MDDVQNAIEVAEFDRALDPVMADLRATGGPLPASIGKVYGDPGSQLIRDFVGRGGSRGIRMPVGEKVAEQIAFVADEVQEWAVEENWGRDSNWPRCPRHPTTHPLEAVVVEGEAAWRCARDSVRIARVGELGASQRE
jgi:hypothetical protein